MHLDDSTRTAPAVTTFPSGAFHPIRAEVRVGAARTRYLRLGTGAPVLALFGASERELWPEIVGALSSHFKVLAPDPDPAASHLSTNDPSHLPLWTAMFLDGLGIPSVSIIASRELAVASLWFALREPDRVNRLVIVDHEGTTPSDDAPPLADRLARSGLPLLLASVPGPSAGPEGLVSALEPIVSFLDGAPPEAA